MSGFATYTALKTALAAGQVLQQSFYKSAVGPASGAWASSWRSGTRPAAGADPAGTPGVAYSSTAGGIVFPDVSGAYKFLVSCSLIVPGNTNDMTVAFADRLVGVGGIAMSSTGDKTINSTALTRYTDGAGVQVWLEITTAGSTTAPIVSLSSYTNQAGTTTRAGGTLTFSATGNIASTLIGPMPLQAGDTGVRSVETLNVATAGGGSGVVSVILLKPLLWRGVSSAQHGALQPTETQLPIPFLGPVRIYDGATIMIMERQNSAGGSNPMVGHLSVVEG